MFWKMFPVRTWFASSGTPWQDSDHKKLCLVDKDSRLIFMEEAEI